MADGGVLQTEGNALLKAVFQGKLRLTRLLLEGGAYINEGNERGETPIAAACLASYDDPQTRRRMVRYLLEKGADPNIPDKSGRTALMHACAERAGREVVALLLENGADPSLKDYGGASALVHALNTGERESLQALLDACKARGQEVIIITSDTSPSGTKKTRQYLNSPPSPGVVEKPAPSCMSPSEVEIATASPADEGVFSFPMSSALPRQSTERRPPPPKLLKRLNSEPWGLAAPLAARRDEEAGGLSRAIAEVNGLSIAERPQLSRRHSIETPDPTSCCEDEAPPGQLLYRRNTAPETQDPRPGPPDARLATQSIPGSPDSGRASAELRRFNASPLSMIASASRESLDGIPATVSPAAATRQRPAGLLERRGSGTLLLDHIAHSRPGFLPPLILNPHRPIPDIRANGRPASPVHKVLVPVAPASPKRGPESKVKKKLMRRHSMQTEQMKQLSTFQEILAESGAD